MRAKKMMAGCLAAALLAAQGSVVLAAQGSEEVTTSPGETNINVSGTYAQTGTPGTVYKVDIAWGSMEFTYTVNEANRTWNPADHTYTNEGSDGIWSCDSGADEITVTNHSNAAVKAGFSYAPAEGYTGITGSFTSAELSLPSAVGKDVNASELTGKTKLELNGALPQTATSLTNIGQITVEINANTGN